MKKYSRFFKKTEILSSRSLFMKPRCKFIVDGIEIDVHSATIIKQSHRYPDTAIVTTDNTDCRWNTVFNDFMQSKVEIYFKYEDIPSLNQWHLTFAGYTTDNNPYGNAQSGAQYVFNCSSYSVLLADDTWTHKWEKARLRTVVYDLVHAWFPIDFQCPNYYVGDYMIEDYSRWSSICDLAEWFGCICYINNAGVLYFGPHNKVQKYVYQFLNNYPRDIDEQNANINEWDIDHKKSGLPYNKIVVVRKDPDGKEIYKGVSESTIPRISGRQKTYTLDHKYIQSDKMAKEIADWILWKYEREYIQLTLKSYGIPFIQQEHVIELVDLPGYSGFYWVKTINLQIGSDFTCDITACTKDPKERFQ